MTPINREPDALPSDLDDECAELVFAMNRLPGIRTIESCCGHGEREFSIDFIAEDIKDWLGLRAVAYAAHPCHSGAWWSVIVRTDCSMRPLSYLLRSREVGELAYAEANKIAAVLDEISRDERGNADP